MRLAASTPGWCLTLPLNVGPSVVCRCFEPLLVSMQGRRLSFGPCEVQDAAALQPVLHYSVQMHVPSMPTMCLTPLTLHAEVCSLPTRLHR